MTDPRGPRAATWGIVKAHQARMAKAIHQEVKSIKNGRFVTAPHSDDGGDGDDYYDRDGDRDGDCCDDDHHDHDDDYYCDDCYDDDYYDHDDDYYCYDDQQFYQPRNREYRPRIKARVGAMDCPRRAPPDYPLFGR